METQEGVIQFSREHTPGDPLDFPVIETLSQWHSRLHEKGLIGQDSERYEGYAYGNMSARINDGKFIISGTQTGGQDRLTSSHYVVIDNCNIQKNYVHSHGPIKPSSECMTHAAVYTASPLVKAVTHVHSPEIWNHADLLGLYVTDNTIDYGTPEMASAVDRAIHSRNATDSGIICMGGHVDGVIAWGASVEQASMLVMEQLSYAKKLV